MVVVKEIIKTCSACPSQWEGITDDNRMIYIRYRWGGLSVRLGEKDNMDISSAVRGKEIFCGTFGDGFDGVMEYSVLKEICKDILNLPEEKVDWVEK